MTRKVLFVADGRGSQSSTPTVEHVFGKGYHAAHAGSSKPRSSAACLQGVTLGHRKCRTTALTPLAVEFRSGGGVHLRANFAIPPVDAWRRLKAQAVFASC